MPVIKEQRTWRECDFTWGNPPDPFTWDDVWILIDVTSLIFAEDDTKWKEWQKREKKKKKRLVKLICIVKGEEYNALVVANRPLKYYENSLRFFTNPDLGPNMNAAITGSTNVINIHDGTDNVYWTGTNIVGTDVTFNSTTQNHTDGGTKSIYFNRQQVNDLCQFSTGSSIDIDSYGALNMWVYVNSDWDINDEIDIYFYNTSIGTQIGEPVSLEDYVNIGTTNIWQKISIPRIDFGPIGGTSEIDAIRIYNAVKGVPRSPRFYLDDIQLIKVPDTGSFFYEYTLEPDKETWLYVDSFKVSIASNIASTLADSTMPNLSYDKLLNQTLTVGINYKKVQNGVVKFTQNIKSILDFLQLPGTEISSLGSDGVNTFLTLEAKHTEPIILKSERGDKLAFTISDDLSGLLQFRIMAGCKVEDRTVMSEANNE